MSSITLYEFNQLPEQQQHVIVHAQATFLDVFEDGNVKYLLYGLEKFYVELAYDVPSNRITKFKTFKRGPLLDKYLDRYEL
mgnify:CR=1 FL=1